MIKDVAILLSCICAVLHEEKKRNLYRLVIGNIAVLIVDSVFPVILGKSHYVLYNLVTAMQPRMLVTFDEELRPLPVSVRVGQVCSLINIFMKLLFF